MRSELGGHHRSSAEWWGGDICFWWLHRGNQRDSEQPAGGTASVEWGKYRGYIDTEINLGSQPQRTNDQAALPDGNRPSSRPGTGVHVDGLTINGGSCPP